MNHENCPMLRLKAMIIKFVRSAAGQMRGSSNHS